MADETLEEMEKEIASLEAELEEEAPEPREKSPADRLAILVGCLVKKGALSKGDAKNILG